MLSPLNLSLLPSETPAVTQTRVPISMKQKGKKQVSAKGSASDMVDSD